MVDDYQLFTEIGVVHSFETWVNYTRINSGISEKIIYAEVGACVDQELPFTVSVSNEKAALRCGADMCHR
jgi:hypothetical protein